MDNGLPGVEGGLLEVEDDDEGSEGEGLGRGSPGEAPVAHLLRRRARWRCAGLYRPSTTSYSSPSSHLHASSTPPPSPLLPFPKFCITLLYSITYLHVVALVLSHYYFCFNYTLTSLPQDLSWCDRAFSLVLVFTLQAAPCVKNIEPKQSSSLLNIYICCPVPISGVSELPELRTGARGRPARFPWGRGASVMSILD
jgi:hypothetical protein